MSQNAENTQTFHVLSFEGPDPYSRAGGIATRTTGLVHELARRKLPVHLWFVGDPGLPGHEQHDFLRLHRWCQWISAYHPAGVYDGEDGKVRDYASSLPPFLMAQHLERQLRSGGRSVILAEEWHTADAVIHLDWLLQRAGLRDRVSILWNANNTFGFDRIDWPKLANAAVITTVSRYMKHWMSRFGVEALAIPNGLSDDAFGSPKRSAVSEIRHIFGGRPIITKIARFDPDKRWLGAVDIVAELKRGGARPILIARGGMEAHGREVVERAGARGLKIVERSLNGCGAEALVRTLRTVNGADVVVLQSHVDPDARRTLFRAADAVLANSAHEPFGLVGLEAMAAGGLACTGCSGEDYAVPGHNALVLETSDPAEFVGLFSSLRSDPSRERAVRRAGRRTAASYHWSEIVERNLMPRVQLLQTAEN